MLSLQTAWGSIPGLGTRIPQATWQRKKKKLITSAPPFKFSKVPHFLPVWQKPNTLHNLEVLFSITPIHLQSHSSPTFLFQAIFNHQHKCNFMLHYYKCLTVFFIHPSSSLLCSPSSYNWLEIWYYNNSRHFSPTIQSLSNCVGMTPFLQNLHKFAVDVALHNQFR